MNGAEALRGLGLGLVLVVIVAGMLLQVLARTVPAPGAGWWARACALAAPAIVLAGLAPYTPGPGSAGLRLLGEALMLLSLGALAEGLLRFGGRGGAWGAAVAATLLYLAAAAVLPQTGALPAGGLACAALALGWAAVALSAFFSFSALAPADRGPGRALLGIAATAAVAALAWGLRAHGLIDPEGPTSPARLPQAALLVLAVTFVACGLLAALLLSAVSLRLAEQLRRESIRDSLTGALDRRGFEQHTARLAALAAQLGQSVVVLMIDIDRFREINERHGRAVGDLALKSLAQLVQRAKRETDAFARLGGEEFCVVLPGTDVPGARVFADRLRRSFEAFEIDTGRSFLNCTISIGVAYASASTLVARELDLVDLLRQADEALDEAKRAGRNRVRFFASAEVMSSRLDSRLFTSTIPHPEP